MSKLVLLEDVLETLYTRRDQLANHAQQYHRLQDVTGERQLGELFIQGANDEVRLLIQRLQELKSMELVTYTCPKCQKTRGPVSLPDEDSDAWYLCFCSSGKTGPGVRMTCPEDKRDPGPQGEKKKQSKNRRKKPPEPFKLEKAKAFGNMTADMS